MDTITGVVAAKARTGKSICIDDVWYGAYNASDLDGVEKGDSVVFNSAKSKCGKYNNIKGKVRKSGSAPASAPKSSSNYNVGVEVGHASNLAMRMMEQLDSQRAENRDPQLVVGSEEYYRQFAEFTLRNYRAMSKIRTKVEANDFTLPQANEAPPAPEPEPEPETVQDVSLNDDEDLF